MLADITITAKDVAQAEERVRTCKKAWERFGCRIVTDKELNEANTHLAQGAGEWRRLHSLAWKAIQLKFGMYWLIEHTGVATWGWLVGGMIVGTAAVALAAVPLVLVFGRPLPVFVGLALCFLLTGSVTAAVLLPLSGRDIAREVGELRARLRVRRGHITVLQERLQGWRNHLSLLRKVLYVHEEYKNAVERHTQLVELLNNRRYQLVHSNWRSLRGTAFEDFVAEIFEELGFTVEKTKASGDQGVDLIVTGRGRRIAVQTKGYKGSVGNKAIQQVYAGMALYQCRECAAVTNSSFTSGAIDLARSVGCRLIDGRGIPRLIEGELY
jgi:hypothetical protein